MKSNIHQSLPACLCLGFFTFSVFAGSRSDQFKWSVFSNDSALSVVSEGVVNTGTIHASKQVTVRFSAIEEDTVIAIFKHSDRKPHLPIFTGVVCAPCRDFKQSALILGWDSYGAGTKAYTGWFLRYDAGFVTVSDWFQIGMPRSCPAILYDTVSNRIAVLASPSFKSDDGPNAYRIMTGTGKDVEVRNREHSLIKSFKGWAPYQNHPYAELLTSTRMDSLVAIAIISIRSNCFTIDTTGDGH